MMIGPLKARLDPSTLENEVTEATRYDRPLCKIHGDEVIARDFKFPLLKDSDDWSNTKYANLTESGDHSPSFYLPPSWPTLLDRVAVIERLHYSEVVRRYIVHGLAIYDGEDGDELNEILDANTRAVLDADEDVLDDVDDTCKVRFDSERTSVPMSDGLREHLTTRSRRAGICRERFISYLIGLSLRTNRDIPKWGPKINPVVEKIRKKLRARKERLRAGMGKLRR